MAKDGPNKGDPGSLISAAARGKLPGWAVCGRKRREHLGRVSDLMGDWAQLQGRRKNDVARWRAAGLLHDALREASPDELRRHLPEKHRALPPKAHHGPAAAVRLAQANVEDEEFLHAIRWHTLGSPSFGPLGKALYAADFLEPGRRSRRRWREGLRERAPRNLDRVLREIVGSKIDYLIRAELPVHRRTVRFWNSLIENP